MKQSLFILSLVILGPKSPGMDIDVYLQPLIGELQELWNVEVRTFDVSRKKYFTMRVQLMWTINDFPAYADLSRYKGCKGMSLLYVFNKIDMAKTREKILLYGS